MTDAENAVPLTEWTEHLEELRRRIIRVLAAFLLVVIAAFVCSERIAAFLMQPVADLGVQLYAFAPTERFMAHLHISAVAGLVVTLPYFLLQAGLFVWPALRGNEKRYALAVLLAAPFLFLSGAGAAYRFFAPVVLRFFLAFGSGDGVEALWGLRAYLSLLAGIMLATGIMLQLPLVLLLLFVFRIVDPKTVARFRPCVILLIFFLAGILTPPDVTSQVMLGIPLYLLFEVTLLIGGLITRK